VAGKKVQGILGGKVSYYAFDGYLTVDGAKAAFSGDGLGKRFASVGFIEQSLSLKVGRLDEIAVNDAQVADAGANEQIGGCRAQRAATDQDYARGQEPLLSIFANTGEKDLARVSILQVRVHRDPDLHGPKTMETGNTGMPCEPKPLQ